MSEEENLHRFRLHFEGVSVCDHALPASILVKALREFQRIVHLLAMAEDGIEVRQQARITHDIESKFSLICHIPEEGGYAQPLDIGNARPSSNKDSITVVVKKHMMLLMLLIV